MWWRRKSQVSGPVLGLYAAAGQVFYYLLTSAEELAATDAPLGARGGGERPASPGNQAGSWTSGRLAQELAGWLATLPEAWLPRAVGWAGEEAAILQEQVAGQLAGRQPAPAMLSIPPERWLWVAAGRPTPPAVVAWAQEEALAVGQREDGGLWVAGAWPGAVGRSGGLTDVVLRCAATLAEVLDGRQPASVLRTALPKALGLAEPADFCWRVAAGQWTPAEGWRVVQVLADAASAQDAVATRLAASLATELARCAAACIEQLGMARGRLPVYVGGRVAETLPGAWVAIGRRVQATHPEAQVIATRFLAPARAVAQATWLAAGERSR